MSDSRIVCGVGDVLRYHQRGGQRDLTEVDRERSLDFADRHVRARTPCIEAGKAYLHGIH